LQSVTEAPVGAPAEQPAPDANPVPPSDAPANR